MMASQTASPLRVGQVLEISFLVFTPRITIHSESKLTVEIVAGDNIGFSDTVEYGFSLHWKTVADFVPDRPQKRARERINGESLITVSDVSVALRHANGSAGACTSSF
jgi:hypothetical protein